MKKMWRHFSLTSWNVHVLKDRLVSVQLGYWDVMFPGINVSVIYSKAGCLLILKGLPSL